MQFTFRYTERVYSGEVLLYFLCRRSCACVDVCGLLGHPCPYGGIFFSSAPSSYTAKRTFCYYQHNMLF